MLLCFSLPEFQRNPHNPGEGINLGAGQPEDDAGVCVCVCVCVCACVFVCVCMWQYPLLAPLVCYPQMV